MTKFLKSAGILAVMALLVAGCSKSSSPTSTSSTPPTLSAPVFKGPGTSADTTLVGQTVNGLATTFNAIASGYTQAFTQAGSPNQSGSTWTWNINGGPYTITFTATQSDTTYQWKYVINGTYEGATYTNWTAFEGSETASGANGDWTLYNDNSTTPLAKVDWTTDSQSNLTGTITGYDSTGTETGKYVFINNHDNSGEIDQYAAGATGGEVMVLKVTWQSDGSGAWTEYDDQGNVIGSGTWA